ncbi:MAG: outer membrane lipoprotein chaperone LolA [Desulfovermiculus sp.]
MFRYPVVLCAVLIVGVLWVAHIAFAQDIADLIQKQYTTVTSFQSQFTQELTNAASGESEERKGDIWYQKPEQIRWHTKCPEEELLVSDGEVVWDYFPEEKVAYKYSLEGRFDSKTMLKFISGEVNLKEDFRIEVLGADSDFFEWTKVRLEPIEPEPSLVMAFIWLDPETDLIRQVLLEDFFGNSNRLTFEDISLNREKDLKPSLFTFDPPEGVEVMEGG